jgi:beta-mannosidase
MQQVDLNGTWQLSWHDDAPQFLTALEAPGRMQLDAEVPKPIHEVLMKAGILDDPRIGLNALKARWVEEQFWVYRRMFLSPSGLRDVTPIWLDFLCLEYDAVIFLNGEEIGRHANAHRPCRIEVTGKLKTDGSANILIVQLDAGLFGVADKSAREYLGNPSAALTKRHWQRKGQWQAGWDWQQRLMNVGILGDVLLTWGRAPRVVQTQVYAVASDDLKQARFTGRVFVENSGSEAIEGTLHLAITGTETETPITKTVNIPVGASDHQIEITIDNPELWWPVGHGSAHRYEVTVALEAANDKQSTTRKIGVRKVEVDQSKHPETGSHFILKINNRPIFCKGGNWVPPDMFYSTVKPWRYAELLDLALQANFNMLRIWGGGIFASHDLLDLCDEHGVLVWHDLLFACAKYPGDHPEFAAEARTETTWALREMGHHASLVVWCGSNEIEEGDWNWGYDKTYKTHPHYALFHHDFPKIAQMESPQTFYWVSSPSSPDYADPNEPTSGDQHPWKVWLGQNPPDWSAYRQYEDRFPNEGGVMGASSPATLKQFLPEGEQKMFSPSWEFHDNPFAIQGVNPGELGRAYSAVQHWTGRDPLGMNWEEYAFASALLQAEGLTEYISNYRRRMFSSASAIFWMYNDSWPTTHGWTIVDYYRRRKLAFHPVRRAFNPVTVIVADLGDKIRIWGVNETQEPWQGKLKMLAFLLDGSNKVELPMMVEIPPNTAMPLSEVQKSQLPDLKLWGVGATLYKNDEPPIAQHRLLFDRFKHLGLVRNPEIVTTMGEGSVTFESQAFVWGVTLDIDGDKPIQDNCFDLLPGVPYTIAWDETVYGKPEILKIGNSLIR